MRYLYACFKNYIGFYNGCGLRKVEIDFTKCQHNIVLICGINGSGKSTLLNSLSPFVDPSSSYIPGADAEKILRLTHEGIIYDIRIISASDSKGGRKQSKAFIQKNGLELNENGNITSYKDIIFSEFDMDSNYISLTKLSSTDRGLGDKTPAERKKFAASIVDNLETYNEMYKTLNKKSLIFKSHINTLHTKIQNIGRKEELQIRLESLKKDIEIINSESLSLNNQIVSIQTRASINQEDAERLSQLNNQKKEVEDELTSIKNQMDILSARTKVSYDQIDSVYERDKELVGEYADKLAEANIRWKTNSEKLSGISSMIHELDAMIVAYESNINSKIEKEYNEKLATVRLQKESILKRGLQPTKETEDSITAVLSFYERFIKMIDSFYDNIDESQLSYIVLNYDPNLTLKLKTELSDLQSEKMRLESELLSINEKIRISSVLNKRPIKCNIDACPFISDALNIEKEFGSIDELNNRVNALTEQIQSNLNESTKIQQRIDISTDCDRRYTILDMIRTEVLRMNKELLNSGDKILSNINLFNQALVSLSQFNDQRNPRLLINSLNDIKYYLSEASILEVLQSQYEVNKDKLKLLDQSKKNKEKYEKDLIECTVQTNKSKTEADSYYELSKSLTQKFELEAQLYSFKTKYTLIEETKLVPVKEQIAEMERKSSNAMQSVNQITEMQTRISELALKANPINSEIQQLSGQLTLLDSYYQEHELYTVKYNMIETLKKYCSPTGGGIQTLFMQLYMSKTLDMANQILGMLFGGEYKLLDFIINQNEFRIPFIGSGLTVDDISSGSCSQICMMGLAINMALFYQASTKYNIARFDEIDSGLDNYNRERIINAFIHIIQILNMEQVFIISHSIELDNSLVDIIKLKMYDNSDQTLLGNIIYDYNKEYEKENR